MPVWRRATDSCAGCRQRSRSPCAVAPRVHPARSLVQIIALPSLPLWQPCFPLRQSIAIQWHRSFRDVDASCSLADSRLAAKAFNGRALPEAARVRNGLIPCHHAVRPMPSISADLTDPQKWFSTVRAHWLTWRYIGDTCHYLSIRISYIFLCSNGTRYGYLRTVMARVL